MHVFNRRAVRRHRERAAAGLPGHDFLFREVAERLADRLDDVRRSFPRALDLGCHGGELAPGGRGGIEWLVRADLSPAMVSRAGGPGVATDEEALPFKDGSFDLILSSLSLHWVNGTLQELRTVLAEAEAALENGISPRVSPFAIVQDVGGLLQRAGFVGPVVDADTIGVSYGDPLRLLADLRGMGESNAMVERRKTFTRRTTLFDAMMRYREGLGDAEGRVPATFEILFLTAWAPPAGA